MVRNNSEMSTLQILLELLYTKNNGESFFVQLRIFFSADASDLLAKAIGFSLPSSNLCEITAPTPYGEVSQESTRRFYGS